MTAVFPLILIALGCAYYFILYPHQKIKRMKHSAVIEVDGATERYPNLLLGNVGIFFDANKDYRVRAVFPILTPGNSVDYIYSYHSVHAVHIPNQDSASAQDQINVSVARELAFLVQDHVRFVEPELLSLREQRRKLRELLRLVTTSEVYSGHQATYQKALLQVESLLDKAEELKRLYVRSIREILIGRKVMAYEPSLLPDNRLTLETKCQSVREEYQQMKDVAAAHAELLRIRQL